MKYRFITLFFLMILHLTCLNQNSNIKSVNIKKQFIDSTGFHLETKVKNAVDSIWKNDKTPGKVGLITRTINEKRKPDFLDTLDSNRVQLLEKYKALYQFDSVSNCLKANYNIIETIKSEIYDKQFFYTAIMELLFAPTATVYASRSISLSDTLISKGVAFGWSSGKSFTDGHALICFDSTHIWLCNK